MQVRLGKDSSSRNVHWDSYVQLVDISIALQKDAIAQRIALFVCWGCQPPRPPEFLRPWKRPLNIVQQIQTEEKVWEDHWYGYF